MKVAITINQIGSVGGVQVFTRDISKILRQRGHSVDIIGRESLPLGDDNRLEERVAEEFDNRNREKHYDVVLCNGEFGYNVDHPKAINVFHGNYYGYALAVKPFVDDELTQRRLKKAELQRNSAKGKYIVTVSDFSKFQLEDFGIPVNQVINNSVDIDLFYPVADIKHSDVALATSRGSYYEKGIDVLKRLADKGVRFKLFSDTSIDSPYVENMGLIDNSSLKEAYNSASVFLNPTRFEGGGLTTLEAMACGCPVVTTPTGYGYDIKDVIQNFVADSFAGFFAKYNLVVNDRERYSKEALDYFWEFHDPSEFKEKWISLIEGI